MSLERSGVPLPENGIGSSFREGPVGQEGGACARMAEPVPCGVGVQGPRGDHTEVAEVPPESLLRKASASDRPNPAGVVPVTRSRTVGRACDARPRPPVPKHPAPVQRGSHDRIPEGEERRSDPSVLFAWLVRKLERLGHEPTARPCGLVPVFIGRFVLRHLPALRHDRPHDTARVRTSERLWNDLAVAVESMMIPRRSARRFVVPCYLRATSATRTASRPRPPRWPGAHAPVSSQG